MNKVEEAIVYATVMHQGKVRKFGHIPFIFHPLEVAQILSTMTDDEDVIAAGILHDIVEDTDGTLAEVEQRFGPRVAELVASESENEYPSEDRRATWQRRKEESLQVLKDSQDMGVRMLWLADKLANMRSLAGIYSERGDEMWQELNQSDPAMHCWYYRSIAEALELSLNKTGAFKEFIKHINYIWPGTFALEKTRYRKYKEVSLKDCELIGRGAKGEVYRYCDRYGDELVIKVFNHNNTYSDVEAEIAQSRRAFVLGVPTALSFGIVSVGDRYGAMYELMDSETISAHIARNPAHATGYARVMASLAHTIHGITVTDEDGFRLVSRRLQRYLSGGIGREDPALAERCGRLLATLPATNTLVHGDFHTGNVFLQDGQPFLIDMDRLATGHPLVEISDLYYFYVVRGEDDPSVVEDFMGFSYQTARTFFDAFLAFYLETEDERVLQDVTRKASFIASVRMVNKIRKKRELAQEDREAIDCYLSRCAALVESLETLAF